MGFWGWLWRRPGPSGFGSRSTAEEVTAGVDASNLTAIVTGATNGIGKETARVLALRGAEVIIPARTLEGGMKVKESISEQIPGSKLHVIEMDLSSLDSVRSFAQSFLSSHNNLNILMGNGLPLPAIVRWYRAAVRNQSCHFLLTNLLLDKMKATARETGVQGRIVNLSSTAHTRSDGSCFDLNKLNDKSKYVPFTAYGHSKLANILHANELSRRFQEEGYNLTANSLHPGVIATNLFNHVLTNRVFSWIFVGIKLFLKSIPQGAATTCYVALHPGLKDVSGKYFADCNEATPTAVARDADLAKKLWEFSEELVDSTGLNRQT